MALQGAIYAHRKAEYTAKVEGYARKFDELAAVISRSQSDAAGYRDRLGLAQTVEQMRTQLEARQVGSKLSTSAAMDSRAEMARSLANARQTAAGARRNLAAMTAERDAYIRGWRAEVSQKLSDATRELSDAREQLLSAGGIDRAGGRSGARSCGWLKVPHIISLCFNPQVHPRQFCRCRWTYMEDFGRFLLAASRLVPNAVLRRRENQ